MYKILLVEDDEIISKSIKQHLENWGFEPLFTKEPTEKISVGLRFGVKLLIILFSAAGLFFFQRFFFFYFFI